MRRSLLKEGLTLHEAMIAIMVRRRTFTMSARELAEWNEQLKLKPQDDGSWPDADQIRLRAVENPAFFLVEGRGETATVQLRDFGDAPRLDPGAKP